MTRNCKQESLPDSDLNLSNMQRNRNRKQKWYRYLFSAQIISTMNLNRYRTLIRNCRIYKIITKPKTIKYQYFSRFLFFFLFSVHTFSLRTENQFAYFWKPVTKTRNNIIIISVLLIFRYYRYFFQYNNL